MDMARSKGHWPVLGRLTQQQFLSRYWQKRAHLVRRALYPVPDIIDADEIAGLCCDNQIESRLIIEDAGRKPWELRRGPFKPSLFKKLPKRKWTVLVNGIDRFLPRVHAVLEYFSFLPFWRIDDIMFSYAVDGGNVGAHVDNYDVFLVQIAGRREWMIEDAPVLHDDFVPGLDVRLLRSFKATNRWVLEPGDMLYLPPRFPHHGIAQGDGCITMSVGFRAPSVADLINGVAANALSRVSDTLRYTDATLKPQSAGAIPHSTVRAIRSLIIEQALNEDAIGEWLGAYLSEPCSDVNFQAKPRPKSSTVIKSLLKKTRVITRAEGARLLYTERNSRSLTLFVNGEHREFSGSAAKLAKTLADHIVVPADDITPFLGNAQCVALLGDLYSAGIILCD